MDYSLLVGVEKSRYEVDHGFGGISSSGISSSSSSSSSSSTGDDVPAEKNPYMQVCRSMSNLKS